VLSLVLSDQTKPPAKLEGSLAQLREKSVLTFRTFTNAFQIWEGSDVDIDERLEQGATHTRDRLSLAENIRQYLPPRPLGACLGNTDKRVGIESVRAAAESGVSVVV
jgi:hypothetical protein